MRMINIKSFSHHDLKINGIYPIYFNFNLPQHSA